MKKKYHELYFVHQQMLGRCYNKNHGSYHRYGARGITVCDQWRGKQGFDNFIKDMQPRPKGLTLDRINNDGNYELTNCRWITQYEQNQNRVKKYITTKKVSPQYARRLELRAIKSAKA